MTCNELGERGDLYRMSEERNRVVSNVKLRIVRWLWAVIVFRPTSGFQIPNAEMNE